MGGPWEDFQQEHGPWEDFAPEQESNPQEQPRAEGLPSGLSMAVSHGTEGPAQEPQALTSPGGFPDLQTGEAMDLLTGQKGRANSSMDMEDIRSAAVGTAPAATPEQAARNRDLILNPQGQPTVRMESVQVPSRIPQQEPTEQAAATFANKVKEYAAYVPYLGVNAVAGLVKPFLAPFEGTRFDSNKMLADAVAYWKGQTGESSAAVQDLGLFPYKKGAGVFETEDPNAPAQGLKIPGFNAVVRPYSLSAKDLSGQTAHGLGFMAGPARVAGKAGGLVSELLPEATPAVLKALGRGITTGVLLGEGKPDLTAENALTFALFDVLGHGLGTATDAAKGLTKKIAGSSWWREMTIKERGLVVQGIEQQMDAMREQGMSDGQVLRAVKRQYGGESPQFKQAWEDIAVRTGRVGRKAGPAEEAGPAEPGAPPAEEPAQPGPEAPPAAGEPGPKAEQGPWEDFQAQAAEASPAAEQKPAAVPGPEAPAVPKPKAKPRGRKAKAGGLDADQVEFIQNRVEQLGSMEAVARVYAGQDSNAGRFAMSYARSVYGEEASAEGEKEEPIPAGTAQATPKVDIQEAPAPEAERKPAAEQATAQGFPVPEKNIPKVPAPEPEAPQEPLVGVVLKSDGKPFPSETAAKTAATGRRKRTKQNWFPVQVPGGWGIREQPKPQEAVSVPPEGKEALNVGEKAPGPSQGHPDRIGVNREGQEILQNKDGVRRVVDKKGIAITQPVRMSPTRGGVKKDFDSPELLFKNGGADLDFLTREELADFEKEKAAPAQPGPGAEPKPLPVPPGSTIAEPEKAPTEEVANADQRVRPEDHAAVSPAGPGGPAQDRGAGDEGPRPANAPGTGAARPAPERPEPAGGRDHGELRGGERGREAELPEGERRPEVRRDEAPAGSDHGQEPGVDGGPGKRPGVRGRSARTDRAGSDYSAPAGSLARTGSWRDTAARNLDIIELAKKLESEGREATPEEQALLAQYVGWGPGEIRNKLFPTGYYGDTKGKVMPSLAEPSWRPLAKRALDLLTGDELKTALRSTQYAHYTSEEMIRAIWDGVYRLGFGGGKILEPGMGTGLFAVAAPREIMEKSRYTGVEMDSTTAAIARKLMPRQNVIAGDFVRQRVPRDFFDLAIGNPPFAKTVILDDPEYKRLRFSLHDYFFAKALDRVRPGGLLVFVTSRYTMDKADDKARAYLADRADLLGAIRLPQTAFMANAGTEVVTDVLFLRKRLPEEEQGGQPWSGLAEVKTPEGPALVNEYFAEHPEMVLGRNSLQGSMYHGKEYTVLPADGDINKLFAEAVKNLPEGVFAPAPARGPDQARQEAVERDFNPASRKEGALYLDEKGRPRIVDSGSGVDVRERLPRVTPKQISWLKDYAGLKAAVKQAQYDQLNDGDWEKSLAALNTAYDQFIKKHGRIKAHTRSEHVKAGKDGEETTVITIRYQNKALLDLDIESPLADLMERINDDGSIEKGPFLHGRTIGKRLVPEIKSTKDALFVSLDQRGGLDLDHVAELAGKDRPAVIKELGELLYEAPGRGWQLADEYLSGDVATKLEEARAAADADSKYERNVQALMKVQPKPLPYDKINLNLGQGWIPIQHVHAFVSEVMGLDSEVSYNRDAALWDVPGANRRSGRGSASEYATPDRSAEEILNAALNNIQITVKSTVDKKTFTDPEATALAQEKVRKVRDDFARWVWQDAGRTRELVDLYNRRFNNIAPRRFDGSHLTLPGLSLKYSLYDHQKRAIWRVVQTGNVYLAHAVGAGKTLEMIVSAMEQRRLGLIRRPMFVVPNHMLRQFSSEFLDAYPAANVMVADEENFHTSNRRRFVAQAALNDPDAIIITHSAFGLIGTKPETMQEVAQDLINQLEAAIEDAKKGGAKYTRSKLEQRLEQIERRISAKSNRKDDTVDFEEMGVDFLYVDEAHEFRKLDFVTNRDKMKGIDPTGSARALDLFAKVNWLEHRYAQGRTHVFASGTPVTNTLAELYSIMRFMDPEGLERDGIETFDAWANMFGQAAINMEQNAAGRYEPVERFSKFVNVPELMKRVRSFMDVLTTSQLKDLVQVPELKTGLPQNVIAKASPAMRAYMDNVLATRIKTSRAWKPSPDEPGNPDPLINIITDGRLAAIDMRFVSSAKNDPGSKLNLMLDRIIGEYRAGKNTKYGEDRTRGGTQIVFSAVGFGKQVRENRGFDVREFITDRLRKAGIPASQVAWMEDYKAHAKKEAMFKEMREGTKRILIGSPKNMGTGVNVQRRLAALHYLSPPWYPADVEQPHGRILRQGNLNPEVSVYWYATKGTYDSTQWGMVARKGKFVEQAMTGDDDVRTIEDISEVAKYEMAAALAAGDDRAIRLASLRGEVEKLHRLKSAHADEQRQFASEVRGLQTKEGRLEENTAQLKQAQELVGGKYISGSEFFATVDGRTIQKHKEAGAAILARARKALSGWKPRTRKDEQAFVLGEVLGKHKVILKVATDEKGTRLIAYPLSIIMKIGPVERVLSKGGEPGKDILDAADPVSLMTRAQDQLNRIGQDLAATRQGLEEARTKREGYERRVGAPFPQEQELAEKIAEAARLEQEMIAESQAQEAAEAAPAAGEEDSSPQFRRANLIDRTVDALVRMRESLSLREARTSPDEPTGRITKRSQALRRAIAAYQSTPIPQAAFKEAGLHHLAAGEGAGKFVQALGRAFGKEVVFFDVGLGVPDYFDGVVLPDEPRLIFAHARAERPHMVVLGHELTHHLRKDHPDLYGILEHVARGEVKGFSRFKTDLDKDIQPGEHPYSDDKAFEELLGDFVGEQFTEHGFWEKVAEFAPDFFGKLVRVVRQFINKVIGRLGDEFRASKYFKDVKAVRDVAAKVYAEYGQREAAKRAVAASGRPGSGGAPQFSRRKPAPLKDDIASTSEIVEARIRAAKGIGRPPFATRAKEGLVRIKHQFTRTFEHLDPKTDGAYIDLLRQFTAVPEATKAKTARILQEIVGGLDVKRYEVFSRALILRDLAKDLESGLLDETEAEGLPFGYKDQAEVQVDLDKYEGIAAKDQTLADALDLRGRVMQDLRQDLVDYGILGEEVLDDPAYFHHMVLEHLAAKQGTGTGSKDVRLHRKGWQRSRVGSIKDYNTEYLEAEFEVLAQGFSQVATAEVMERIKGLADIRKRLKREAKAENYRALIARLKASGRLEYYPEDHRDPKKRGQMKDPLQPWNSKIAMGMGKLGKMAAAGELSAPGFEDFIEALGDDWRSKKAAEEDAEQSMPAMTAGDPRFFPFLSNLMANDLPGASLAGMIFKAMRGRENFIKEQLGGEFKTWESIVPPGYVRWKPAPGTAWYMGRSLTERALEKVLSGERVEEGEVRSVLMRGRDEEWVIPENLAAQLDQVRTFPDENMISRLSSRLISTWKQWVLLNPPRLFKYNLNNMSGDSDIVMAYNPVIFKEATRAARDLAFATRSSKLFGNAVLRGEIEEAERLGVLSSAWSINEVQDVTGALGDRGYIEFLQQSKLSHLNLAKRYWKEAKDFTRYRENILRLAAFRWFKRELGKGRKLYGASDPAQVDKIANPTERAAKLARELIGDYGAITVAGQWIRKHMIPFYSWMEINAPRYLRMFRNLGSEEREPGEATRGKAAAFGTLLWKGMKLGFKVAAFMGLVQLWNWTFFPKESEEIGSAGRRQLHLILGRNRDGSIRSMRFQGAFSDMLSWLGLENPVESARELAAGEKTWADQGADSLKAPFVRLYQGARPIARSGIEALYGVTGYPEPSEPRAIRDRAEFLLRTWSVDSLYRHLAGKPTRAAAEELFGLVGYTTDPGQAAYFDALQMVREWKERHVPGGGGSTVIPGEKANALYYAKQAIRFKDKESVAKYLQQYVLDTGGTGEGLQRSLRAGIPGVDLTREQLLQFTASLSTGQRKTLARGVTWYQNMLDDAKKMGGSAAN